MLKNISTTTLTIAKKRWRRVYFTLQFSKAMMEIANKLSVSQISIPSYSVIETISGGSNHTCSIDPSQLTDMVKDKDLEKLHEFGGVEGLANEFGTTLENGRNFGDVNRMRTMFGSNTYKKQPRKGLLYFVVKALKDIMILFLMVCGEGWYVGRSIFLVVFVFIVVSAISNFRQERQFHNLSKISNDIKIDVVRDEGRRQEISIVDIVVGDVVVLNIGDQIPADGLFIDGHSTIIDESSVTGESYPIEVDSLRNPFLYSGSKVVDGNCRMLVVSVGMNTVWGKLMSSRTGDYNDEETPLQARLIKLTSSIQKLGLMVGFLVTAVMLIRCYREYNGTQMNKINGLLDSVKLIFSAVVPIVMVVIPEGLPNAVTLTIAHSMNRMISNKVMVRSIAASETMGSATVICTHKTGTLTMNQMTVAKFWLGHEYIARSSSVIAQEVLQLLHEGVWFNTTGTVFKSESIIEYSGCPTEKAILTWALVDLKMDMEQLKKSSFIVQLKTFNSKSRQSGVMIRHEADHTDHVHWKGAAEIILAMCSSYYQSNGRITRIYSNKRTQFEKIIEGMAASSLRCIAFAYKQDQTLSKGGLTLLGIIGLTDPCRPGAYNAIDIFRSAGVEIKMITGDNVFTAKAIATECGIRRAGGDAANEEQVILGEVFRNLTHQQRMQRVDNIRVMARASPFDKLLMVRCLKRQGHVVAFTGGGTEDATALKEADIGFSMGIQGTEVAKQSSDIVNLDDNILSVALALRWGRCVHNNIQKLIQFQLTITVADLVINFIAAFSAPDVVQLRAVQLLWVNLIMDTLGALALATDRPTDELLYKPPVGRDEPLITNIMWRNLCAQSIFQIVILLTFRFRGKEIFDVDDRVNNTIIFNTFVLCQVFNIFNSRKLEKRNIFKGIFNRLFMSVIGMIIVLQVVMVEFIKNFADTDRLNGAQWAICIAIAALSWPIGLFVKLIPVPQKPFFNLI